MAGLVGSRKGKHLDDRSMQRNRGIYRKYQRDIETDVYRDL